MALTDESGSGMVMPVAPAYGGGGFGNGFGGDGSWWILLLFILLGGWNNGFGGGYGGDNLYPWMNQAELTNGGFRDQMLNTSINGIQQSVTTGFGDVQNALCGGFAGVNASINAAQGNITNQLYSNTIADLERSYAAQTASSQGMNAIQSQLAQCLKKVIRKAMDAFTFTNYEAVGTLAA